MLSSPRPGAVPELDLSTSVAAQRPTTTHSRPVETTSSAPGHRPPSGIRPTPIQASDPVAPKKGGSDSTDHSVGVRNLSNSTAAISQVYSAGGDTGATYNSDFIELFNPSNSTINLSGWSLQFANVASGTWQVIPLFGSITSGHYRLIRGTVGSTGAALPTPDQTATFNLAAAAGKVALVNTTTALSGVQSPRADVIDLVGYGTTADWYEGSAPTLDGSATLAQIRRGSGNYDSDQNLYDFNTTSPSPRNSASATANRKPIVTMPDEVVTPLNTTATISGVSIADPDVGAGTIQVSVTATNGAASLSSLGGLTFSEGDGVADAAMTFSGTLANVNLAISNLSVAPAAGFRGASVVGIGVDDNGNTGVGGSLIGYTSTRIIVDGPVVAVNDSLSATEDTALRVDFLSNDDWIGNAPAISFPVGPSHGTVAFDSQLGAWKYTPALEYSGSDSFTYRLDDGLGHVSNAVVSLTVAAVNDALVDSSDEAMTTAEGELVNVRFRTPNATAALAWTAVGLPTGLSINASTGVISGRPQYDQAGDRSVALTVSGGGDLWSETFNWNVRDTNRWMEIDNQVHRQGESVVVAFQAQDAISNSLTYSFANLPPGVTYDPFTGFVGQIQPTAGPTYSVTASVSGGGATDIRSFQWSVVPTTQTVTAFATNGSNYAYDDIGFVGKHLPISVKLFYGAGAFGSQIKLQVTAGAATLTTDPNATVGTNSVIVNASGWPVGTTGADLIPSAPSAANDDIVVTAYRMFNGNWVWMGEDRMNAVTLQMGSVFNPANTTTPDLTKAGLFYADTTPKAMIDQTKYRIPPRVWTTGWVKKTGELGDKELWLVAPKANQVFNFGTSEPNGRLELGLSLPQIPVGQEQIKLDASRFNANGVALIKVRGWTDKQKVYQTAPGSSGRLFLAMFNKSKTTDLAWAGASAGFFSVSAIPTRTTAALKSKFNLVGPLFANPETRVFDSYWGAMYAFSFVSDSGRTSELDQAYASEFLTQYGAAGILKTGIDTSNGVFDTPASEIMYDYHVLPFTATNQAGLSEDEIKKAARDHWSRRLTLEAPFHVAKQDQYWQFVDLRSGMTAAKPASVRNSGYLYELEIDQINAKKVEARYTIKLSAQALPAASVLGGDVHASAANVIIYLHKN